MVASGRRLALVLAVGLALGSCGICLLEALGARVLSAALAGPESLHAAAVRPPEDSLDARKAYILETEIYPMRRLALILQIASVALVCSVVSIKKTGAPAQTEKLGRVAHSVGAEAMRREIPAQELQKHARPGDVWVAVDGLVCDISDFVHVHPGGADLLLQLAGADLTEQYREVGHSEFAGGLIKARAVGVLVESGGGTALGGAPAERARRGALASALARMGGLFKTYLPRASALFTREDPFQIHKLLGVAVLVHYLVRFGILLKGDWLLPDDPPDRDPFGFGPDWFSLLSVWFHVLLQVSSFQFILPRNRVLGKPMLWQEWRAHNLIFVLRSVMAFTLFWADARWRFESLAAKIFLDFCQFACVLFQLKMADVASRALRDSKHESLTASWPLWEGCPALVEHFLKFYYTIGINQLTLLVLEPHLMLLPFIGIVILQTDSFAMTLVRKSVIRTETFHGYYWWNMLHVVMVIFTIATERCGERCLRPKLFPWLLLMYLPPIAVYALRYHGVSKYGVWTAFFVRRLVHTVRPDLGDWSYAAIPAAWAVWSLVQFSLAGFVLEYRVRRFVEGGRAKPLRCTGRERVAGSLYRLTFRVPGGYACGLMPGQHLRLVIPNRWQGASRNGQENAEAGAEVLSRAYTPISAPDARELEICVRHYPPDPAAGFPQGGRASRYLVEELRVGDDVLVSGPHGSRVYFGDGLFEVQVGRPRIRPRLCLVLAGGSGITPALAIIREVHAEMRRRRSRVQAARMLDWENRVALERFAVLHANRSAADALPRELFEGPETEEGPPVPVRVHSVITGGAEGRAGGAAEDQEGGGGDGVRHGRITRELVASCAHGPADKEDVVVLVCGPRGFVAELCLPLLEEMGYTNVIAMW